jgi:hypothetical protein
MFRPGLLNITSHDHNLAPPSTSFSHDNKSRPSRSFHLISQTLSLLSLRTSSIDRLAVPNYTTAVAHILVVQISSLIMAFAASQGQLKLLQSGDFSDFTILCRDQEFRVHRVVICAESDFFITMCKSAFKVLSSMIHTCSVHLLTAPRRLETNR